jgi:hypothetical protein
MCLVCVLVGNMRITRYGSFRLLKDRGQRILQVRVLMEKGPDFPQSENYYIEITEFWKRSITYKSSVYVFGEWILEICKKCELLSRELPKMDGTAQYGRGHDRPPQDGYRGTRGE